jgi:hypothetical protein
MLFEVYNTVDKDSKDTYSSNALTKFYKDMVIATIISHGQVMIWKARDDERYMDALHFEKDDLKKMRIVYSVCCYCSSGWSVEARTTLMD